VGLARNVWVIHVDQLEKLARGQRVTVRRSGAPDSNGRCVVYWMQRAQRAVDNPALETAIKAANILGKPVVTFLGLVPFYPNANLRHYEFLAEGLPDTAKRLGQRGVGFVIRRHRDHDLVRFCEDVRAALVVGDENPLREPERWRQVAAEHLRVPFWTVDADVIVPSKLLEKEQYAARTIRPRIRALLDEFLVPVGNVRPRVRWKPIGGLHSLVPESDLLEGLPIDRSVQPVSTFHGGTTEAQRFLKRFLRERLNGYSIRRNRPELDGTSQLSPYLHFGHIGPHTIALAVKHAHAPAPDRDAFLEELIVRRELAVNFVRFNPRYDSLEGCERWALCTLAEHARDERAHRYTERQLENAETHDPLWNAAQQQMVQTGWMHGYLRMYWAKKILEWSRSATEAFDIAVKLNDRYELDGRDPNGYAGIAWAIGGKHDRAWGPERPVFGKIRYMSYQSTSRKFDSQAYIRGIDELVAE
jgi:deoxyribodipyrimidine photo-lyase